MTLAMGDKRQLILLLLILIGIGAVAYTWYPRLFPRKPPVRPAVPLVQAPTLVEVPTEKPTPPPKAKPAPSPVAKAPQEPDKEKAAKTPGGAPAPAEKAPTAFGLEFPPFVTAGEADECEQRLNQEGLTSFRSVTYLDDGLYAALVGPFPNAGKASEAVAEVKAKPGSPPKQQGEAKEFFFEDGPYNLREVVQRAMEIRGKGYGVRVVVVDGKAPIYRIRTATKLDSAQVKKLSGQYRELGCPNRVVAAR